MLLAHGSHFSLWAVHCLDALTLVMLSWLPREWPLSQKAVGEWVGYFAQVHTRLGTP